MPNPVTAVEAATPGATLDHFSARLAFETDASDVAARLAEGTPGIVVVDTRSAESGAQGHVRGAVHLPYREVIVADRREVDGHVRL